MLLPRLRSVKPSCNMSPTSGGRRSVKVNIFRIGRWVEAALIALWLIGCLNDFIFLELWKAKASVLLIAISFTATGVALIMLGAWAIGWALRRIKGIPRGRDFREKQVEAF